jgi:hypothetical protein
LSADLILKRISKDIDVLLWAAVLVFKGYQCFPTNQKVSFETYGTANAF